MRRSPDDSIIENRTFEELAPGDSASLTRTLRQEDLELLALAAGEAAPALPEPAAPLAMATAHDIWAGALLAGLLATRLPGPGTSCTTETLRFLAPLRWAMP